MAARWTLGLWFVGLSLVASSANVLTQLPELRDLDLSNWDCASKLEGVAKTPDGQERNRQKNRPLALLGAVGVLSHDMASFRASASEYDRQIGKKRRRELSPQEKAKVANLEQQIVSVTGWLVLAYQGIPETTNCKSQEFLD